MSKLSDRPGRESDIILSGANATSGEVSGWETNVRTSVQNLDYKLIRAANTLISLQSVLKQYSVDLEQQYSSSGWTHKGTCPFPAHKDNRPSFGYNSTEDRFNCFGCKRSGRSVEFIAFMKGKTRIQAAKELIGDVSSLEDIPGFEDEMFDYKRLEDLLFGYSDTLREFKRSNNNSIQVMEYAAAVTWNLDLYLRKNVPFNSVVLDDLEVRISKLIEQIELYEDSQ